MFLTFFSLLWAYGGEAHNANKYVTKSQLVPLTAQHANTLRDKVLGQEKRLYLESQQNKKMVDSCPEDPS